MSNDIWDALLPLADIVLWCTPASQAWRQSEAAIWESVPEALQARSLLLLTRIDTVRSETDRARLLNRVRRETDGQFRAVLPVFPLLALEEGDDADLQRLSGLPRLMDMIAALVEDIQTPVQAADADTVEIRRAGGVADPYSPRLAMMDATHGAASPATRSQDETMDAAPPRVVPRRVRPGDGAERPSHRRPREALI
jgi:hypothetical protein